MDTDELDWNRSLREQWEWHWNHQVRARLVGLTDDEYFWSPVPDAWSVRPRGTSTVPLHVGAGAFTIDYAFPQPVPPPFATIAWRLGHVIVGVLALRNAAHFGAPATSYDTCPRSACCAISTCTPISPRRRRPDEARTQTTRLVGSTRRVVGGTRSGAGDLASLEAGRAHVQPRARATVHAGPNGLDVRVPTAVGTAV
jgi:DinB superfamily